MNEDYYEQFTVNHPIFNAQNSLFNAQNEFLNSQNKLMEQMMSMCDMVGQLIQKKEEEKRIEEEQAAKDRYWKIPVCYDNDDDEESSILLKDIISELPPCVAITPDSPKTNSLIMEDEHLDTILETESDELIKSSVENLVQILSKSEDSSEGECDLPPYDDSSKNHDLTFSNPLFDIEEGFTSSDESFSEEDVPNENLKIFSNPLFDRDEEITSTKVDQIDDEVLENTNSIPPGIEYLCFNAKSDLLESLLHRDTSINDSQKIDSLLDEFVGELTLLKSIPLGIHDVNLDPEGEIHLVKRLLYDNSSPRPPEKYNFENPIESFSPSPIPSDPDVSSPSGDRNKIYDLGICIEVESTRFLAPISPVIDTLLPFSSENEDTVFNHGVLAYNEKSPPSSSHRGLKAFQLSPKSPMMIHGDNTHNLGVRHPYFYPP
ncbi:hypothetical protein Tco_0289526 [Tanacetum coccineum]